MHDLEFAIGYIRGPGNGSPQLRLESLGREAGGQQKLVIRYKLY